jgi:Domain of unknown function (DUF4352)
VLDHLAGDAAEIAGVEVRVQCRGAKEPGLERTGWWRWFSAAPPGSGLTACAPLPAKPAAATVAKKAQAVTPTPAPGPTVAPAGSAVRDGKFEFRVVSIERAKTVGDPTGNPYMKVTAQGEFVVVTISVKNIGDQSQSYFGLNQKLIDASGRQYAADTTADMWMNTGNNPLGAINPGNWIQVRIAFDVAPGTQVGEMELHDSMFSGGANVRLV